MGMDSKISRDEACVFISMLAQNELIAPEISKCLLKARNIIVCEANTILDVLANEDEKAVVAIQFDAFMRSIGNSSLFSDDIKKKAIEVRSAVHERICNGDMDAFADCKKVYLQSRCMSCKYYKGEVIRPEGDVACVQSQKQEDGQAEQET